MCPRILCVPTDCGTDKIRGNSKNKPASLMQRTVTWLQLRKLFFKLEPRDQ